MLFFDCETNGLLHELDRVHCLVIKDARNGTVIRYSDQPGSLRPLKEGVHTLMEATERGIPICGHNVIKFDVPALQKVYPWFKPVMSMVLDTMVLARLLYPDLIELDSRLRKQGVNIPPGCFKKHTLEAWGYRCGNYKGDFKGPWDEWTQEMEDYCVQDVEVTHTLHERLTKSKLWPGPLSSCLEHAVARILGRQERHGFLFNVKAAEELYRKLAKKRVELSSTLAEKFRPFYMAGAVKTPKRSAKVQVEELGENRRAPVYEGRGKAKRIVGYKFHVMEYTEGSPYTAVKLTTFNPASRDHVAHRLMHLYGWIPSEFTDDGKPKVDETVLKGLPYPEAPVLEEYFTVAKRLGQLAEGREAWLKHVGADGRIHGGVNTNGAVTGRMTHMYPNVAQTPATRSAYGHECRALWCVPEDKEQVGADADALELRDLAHFMAVYDGGAYVDAVNAGKKADGTDAHSVNCRAIGMDPKALIRGNESGRDIAKTWFYAFIYGAGDEKLGLILLGHKKGAKRRGRKSRDDFAANVPALAKLKEAVVRQAKKNGGYIRGLDGRFLRIRSEHAALNTLLQSAGALNMKLALVILDTKLQEAGLVPGINYEFIANVHDEWQIECDIGLGERIGRMAVEAIRQAGEEFGFRCPLTGAYSVGRNWADTH